MGHTVTRSVARREEIMPIPGGQITTSTIWTQPVEEPVVEETTEETEEETDDL